MPFLVYDGSCFTCARIAESLSRAGRGRFQILPLQTAKARKMLDDALPAGWKRDIYYLDDSNGRVRVLRGPRAAWRAMLDVGFGEFWRSARNVDGAGQRSVRGGGNGYASDRRETLRLMIYGTFYMGLGALLGGLGGLDQALGQALAGPRNCSSVDTSLEEVDSFVRMALADAKIVILKTYLTERGFDLKAENSRVSQVACDTKRTVAVFLPNSNSRGGLVWNALAVSLRENGQVDALGFTITGDLAKKVVTYLRVVDGTVEETSVEILASEGAAASPLQRCDRLCLDLCTYSGGYGFYSSCVDTCLAQPNCHTFNNCVKTCLNTCSELTRLYCCSLCDCDVCPI